MFMDKVPLMVLIFYSIPESFLIFTFGHIVLGYPIKIRPIILATLISVPTSYLARLLPFPFGIHSLIGVGVILILFTLICRFSIKDGVIATFLSLGTLIALDNSILYFLQVLFKLDIQGFLVQSPIFRTLIGYPQLIVWALITIFIYKKKYSLGGKPNESRNRKQSS